MIYEPNRVTEYFEFIYKNSAGVFKMRFSPESTLDELIEHFECFLKGSGFSFNGQVQIIEEEIDEEEEEIKRPRQKSSKCIQDGKKI